MKRLESMFSIIFGLSLFFVASFYTIKSIQKYRKKLISTSVTEEFKSDVVWPVITLCTLINREKTNYFDGKDLNFVGIDGCQALALKVDQ